MTTNTTNMMVKTCPCQSHQSQQKNYADCCQPHHLAKTVPTTAKQLMRSRYSAYVLQNIDYIVATTVPAQQLLLNRQALAAWAKQTDWAGLELINHIPKLGKRHASVEFKAFFNTPDGMQAHHEHSAFVKITDKLKNTATWYFLDPTVSMKIPQKQPCICGSGEKFKRCCGQFFN